MKINNDFGAIPKLDCDGRPDQDVGRRRSTSGIEVSFGKRHPKVHGKGLEGGSSKNGDGRPDHLRI